jgi:bifunctional DNase/RNase
MIEVVVARLGLDSSTNSYVLVLQEKGGERLLPIWIGQPEAESIVMQMHNLKRVRPLTHDLCKNVIQGLGGQLRRVQITRVEKNTYYAELHVQRADGGLAQIDARPSDSIAVALRFNAPIFAAETLLSNMTIETGEPEETEQTLQGGSPELDAEQLKSYLEQLRPEDFGKFNP